MSFMVKKLFPANWVRQYRKDAGLSAQQLGDLIGMTKEGITKIERREGGLSIENAKKIADALEVHYVDIIDGPADRAIAQTEAQKKVLEALNTLSEREQQLYVNAFLSGLNPPKPEAQRDDIQDKKKTS